MSRRYRVLAPNDFPADVSPDGLAAFLERQHEDGWAFAGTIGKLAVFRHTAATAPVRKHTASLVEEDEA